MPRRAAVNVLIEDPVTGRTQLFGVGDSVPDELAATVTNEAVWADDATDVDEPDTEQRLAEALADRQRLANAVARVRPGRDVADADLVDVVIELLEVAGQRGEQVAAQLAEALRSPAENGDGGDGDGEPPADVTPAGQPDAGDGGEAKSPRRRRASSSS